MGSQGIVPLLEENLNDKYLFLVRFTTLIYFSYRKHFPWVPIGSKPALASSGFLGDSERLLVKLSFLLRHAELARFSENRQCFFFYTPWSELWLLNGKNRQSLTMQSQSYNLILPHHAKPSLICSRIKLNLLWILLPLCLSHAKILVINKKKCV